MDTHKDFTIHGILGELTEELAYIEWTLIGSELAYDYSPRRRHRPIMWELGDFLLYGEMRWGSDRTASVVRLLRENLDRRVLRRAVNMARAFPYEVRRTEVPFWSYPVINQIQDPVMRIEVLDAAAVGKWTRRRIQEEVDKVRQYPPPAAPRTPLPPHNLPSTPPQLDEPAAPTEPARTPPPGAPSRLRQCLRWVRHQVGY